MIHTKYECWSYVLIIVNLVISAFVGVMTQDFMGCFLFSILGYILNNYRDTIKNKALIIIFILGLLLALVDIVNSFV